MEVAQCKVALEACGGIATHAASFDIFAGFAGVIWGIKVVTGETPCAVVGSSDTFLALFGTGRA